MSEQPAWLRRGIVPAPHRDEREQAARRVAKELGAEVAAKVTAGQPFEPARAVVEHLGAEVVLTRARELGVGAEDFRCWVMCAVIDGWPAKVASVR